MLATRSLIYRCRDADEITHRGLVSDYGKLSKYRKYSFTPPTVLRILAIRIVSLFPWV